MNKIIVRSPTRVDLAGGTLDLWPLYNFVGGAQTVNVAVDIYTTAELEIRQDASIELHSEDLALNKKYANLKECLKDPDEKLLLLKIQLQFWQPQRGFRLSTRSDSPVGGGLGGSSSMTVSLMKAFAQLEESTSPAGQKKMRFANTLELVHTAHNLEAHVLNTPTGTQDYFPAASGGLNILSYQAQGIQQQVLPIAGSDLQDHFLLVYTGRSHHSGINNFEVLTRAVHRDPQVMGALYDIKNISARTAMACMQGKYQELPELFRQEFAARVKLAKSFSSPEIELLHEVSLQAGAEAVKICGAGGGGCVLVWVHPKHRQGVVEACQKNGFTILAAKPVPPLA